MVQCMLPYCVSPSHVYDWNLKHMQYQSASLVIYFCVYSKSCREGQQYTWVPFNQGFIYQYRKKKTKNKYSIWRSNWCSTISSKWTTKVRIYPSNTGSRNQSSWSHLTCILSPCCKFSMGPTCPHREMLSSKIINMSTQSDCTNTSHFSQSHAVCDTYGHGIQRCGSSGFIAGRLRPNAPSSPLYTYVPSHLNQQYIIAESEFGEIDRPMQSTTGMDSVSDV